MDFLITHTEVLKQCITSWKGVSMASEDFCGHAGQLNTGDLQWMTMGWGIVHAEMPCSEESVHGLQLWVNLRSSQKMVEPWYQEVKSSEIPKPVRMVLPLLSFLEKPWESSPRFTLTHQLYIWTSDWTKEQSIPSLFLKGDQASFIPCLETCILDLITHNKR